MKALGRSSRCLAWKGEAKDPRVFFVNNGGLQSVVRSYPVSQIIKAWRNGLELGSTGSTSPRHLFWFPAVSRSFCSVATTASDTKESNNGAASEPRIRSAIDRGDWRQAETLIWQKGNGLNSNDAHQLTFDLLCKLAKEKGYDGVMDFLQRTRGQGFRVQIEHCEMAMKALAIAGYGEGELSRCIYDMATALGLNIWCQKTPNLLKFLENHRCITEAEKLLIEMRRRGLKPSMAAMHKLLRTYTWEKRLKEAEQLCQEGFVTHGLIANRETLIIMLEGYELAKEGAKAMAFVRKVEAESGVQMDTGVKEALFRCVLSARDWPSALSILQTGLTVSPTLVKKLPKAVIADLQGDRGSEPGFSDVRDIILPEAMRLRSTDDSASLRAVKRAALSSGYDGVARILIERSETNGAPLYPYFQAALKGLLAARDVEGMSRVVHELMGRLQFKPKDAWLHSLLIRAYAQEGNPEAAEKELSNMSKMGISPNVHCLKLLLLAYRCSPRYMSAKKILSRRRGSVGDLDSVGAALYELFRLYGALGLTDKLVTLYEDVQSLFGVETQPRYLDSVVMGYGELGEVEKVSDFALKEYERHGWQPSSGAWRHLACSDARTRRMNEARSCIAEVGPRLNNSQNLELSSIQRLLEAYAELGMADEAEACILKMEATYGHKPEARHLECVALAHGKAGNVDRMAEVMVTGFRERGLQLPVMVCRVLVHHYVSARRLAEAHSFATKMMPTLGVQSDFLIWEMILVGYVQNRQAAKAVAVYKSMEVMHRASLEPRHYDNLVKVTAKMESVDKTADLVLNGYKQRGWKPTLAACNWLLRRYIDEERLSEAEKFIFEVMPTLHQQPDVFMIKRLMAGYATMGKLEKLQELLQKGDMLRGKSQTWLIRLLVAAHANLGNLTQCKQLLDILEQQEGAIDGKTAYCYIKALAENRPDFGVDKIVAEVLQNYEVAFDEDSLGLLSSLVSRPPEARVGRNTGKGRGQESEEE